MNPASSSDSNLRLWPGVLALALQWFGRFVLPVLLPAAMPIGMMGSLVLGAVILIWWAFFSRAPRIERFGGAVLVLIALFSLPLLAHKSIAGGMMGFMPFIYGVPLLSLALVGWAVSGRHLSEASRRPALVAAVALACASLLVLRTEGMDGDASANFQLRWSPTAEERLLAESEEPVAGSVAVTNAEGGEWPGFRGVHRDGGVAGVRVGTDWSQSPPEEVWSRPVGPGWSSFAVSGELFFTQEQRGEEEVVTAYELSTGEPVWLHADTARFWESNAGAGPRSTPTYHEGRLYTLGATGLLNVLDAADGSVVWSRNAEDDAGTEVPDWAYSGSPLVWGDVVLVPVSAALMAYDRETGEPRWKVPARGVSYSSPHLMTVDGVEQVLFQSGYDIASYAVDGTELWKHEWTGYPIVQPAQNAEGDVLFAVNSQSGLRRLAVTQGEGGWNVEEVWTSIGLKPYFSDYVLHDGHAYGFDGGILSCIELESGERQWKGGRYGHGQMIRLSDQGVLLVLSEKGGLAVVRASPEGFEEITKAPAIEGKTWNHPVLVNDLLLVRNDESMAAFRLPPARG